MHVSNGARLLNRRCLYSLTIKKLMVLLLPLQGVADAAAGDTGASLPPGGGGGYRTGKAVYSYVALNNDELGFQEGEVLTILREAQDAGWLVGRSALNREGLVPSTHIEFITTRPPPPKDLFSQAPAAEHKIAVGKHSYERESPDELSFKVTSCKGLCISDTFHLRQINYRDLTVEGRAPLSRWD